MSTTTPYIGLTLYDSSGDQAVTFSTFRAVWGGTASTSNFYKIDTSLSGLNTRITTLENASGAVTVQALYISANFYQATGVTGITAYNTDALIILSVDTTSNGTVTLDINSLGTKSVMKVDSTGVAINLTGSDLVKGRNYLFKYDGTRWLWVSANSADQIQIVGTSGNVVTVGSTNNLQGTVTQSVLISGTVNSATAKTTPVSADKYALIDSEASNVLKHITHANLLAAMTPTDYIIIRCVKDDTDLPADGTLKVGGEVPMPYTGTIVSIFGDVDTAGTTGTMTVDGTTIMATTKLNWDSTEKSTRTYSGTVATLSTTAITAGDLFSVDIDTNHTTKAKGLTITIGVRR
jgi:hypothetical protein